MSDKEISTNTFSTTFSNHLQSKKMKTYKKRILRNKIICKAKSIKVFNIIESRKSFDSLNSNIFLKIDNTGGIYMHEEIENFLKYHQTKYGDLERLYFQFKTSILKTNKRENLKIIYNKEIDQLNSNRKKALQLIENGDKHFTEETTVVLEEKISLKKELDYLKSVEEKISSDWRVLSEYLVAYNLGMIMSQTQRNNAYEKCLRTGFIGSPFLQISKDTVSFYYKENTQLNFKSKYNINPNGFVIEELNYSDLERFIYPALNELILTRLRYYYFYICKYFQNLSLENALTIASYCINFSDIINASRIIINYWNLFSSDIKDDYFSNSFSYETNKYIDYEYLSNSISKDNMLRIQVEKEISKPMEKCENLYYNYFIK